MNFNSKIYVAGHCGFIGNALYTYLLEHGYHNVIGKTTQELDLRVQANVHSFFEEERPEYVFLLSAKCGNVAACRDAPAEFLYDNLAIESNVINAAYVYGVKKLLFISTISSYPKECYQPILEKSFMTGALESSELPYAMAKLAGMYLCHCYNQQYDCNFITGILPNIYGPGSNFNPSSCHVIPSMLMKFHSAVKEGRDVVDIWGSGRAVRDFLYIDDLVIAMIFLMNEYENAEPINITAENHMSIAEIAELIRSVTNFSGRLFFDVEKPEGTLQRCLDGERIRNMGWKPSVTFQDGIEKTHVWYTSHIAENQKI